MSRVWYLGGYFLLLLSLTMGCSLIAIKPPQVGWLGAILVTLPTLMWVPVTLVTLAKEGWWPK